MENKFQREGGSLDTHPSLSFLLSFLLSSFPVHLRNLRDQRTLTHLFSGRQAKCQRTIGLQNKIQD